MPGPRSRRYDTDVLPAGTRLPSLALPRRAPLAGGAYPFPEDLEDIEEEIDLSSGRMADLSRQMQEGPEFGPGVNLHRERALRPMLQRAAEYNMLLRRLRGKRGER